MISIVVAAMLIKSLWSKLRPTMRNFCCARGGNVALIFAASAVPLIMGVGAAVDYSRANSMKAAMQTAVDSTGLTLGRKYSTLSASQLQNQASLIFASLFTRPEAKNPTITAVENASAGTIQVNATASMDTAFVGILGLKSIQVDVTATTSLAASSSLRVALVLDNTGSMAQSGKMPALQTAAKNLIARIQSAATTNGLAYVSIVPFVKDVNLGSSNYNQSWLQWDDGTDNSWDGSKGTCSNSSYSPRSQCLAQGTCSISGNNSQSSCTAAATCSISGYSTQSSCTAAAACSNPGKTTQSTCTGTKACSNKLYTTQSQCTFHHYTWGYGTWSNGVWTAGVWTPQYTWTPTSHSTWTGCVVDRGDSGGPSSGNYDANNVLPTTGTPATLYVPEQYSSCPQAAMGLSYNWSAMNSLINAMSPAGNTNQAIGLQLGWMTLMSGGVFNAPAMDPNVTYGQHIILLTDGLNTQDRWYVNQSSIDARQQILCNNIKAAGITLWTIQVNTGGDPTSTLLQNCASDPDKFYLLTSANQIISTFDEISFKIVHLHLSQ